MYFPPSPLCMEQFFRIITLPLEKVGFYCPGRRMPLTAFSISQGSSQSSLSHIWYQEVFHVVKLNPDGEGSGPFPRTVLAERWFPIMFVTS